MSIPRRSRRTSYLKIQAAVSLAAFAATAWGQSVHTWNGAGGDGNWSNTANWVDGNAPNGNDEVHFAGMTNLNPFRDALAPSAGYRVFFDIGAGAFTLDGSAYSLFDFGGNNPKIENNSTSTQTINFALTLDGTGGGSSAEINPVQGNLVFNNTVALAGTNATQLRIFGNNGNTVTFNGAISGSNSVIVREASNVIYTTANTYSGDTFINAGTLQLASGASVASGFIRIGDTGGSVPATLALTSSTGGQTISTPINVRAATGLKTIRSANSSGTNTFSGNVFLDGDATVSADLAGGVLAFSGTTLDLKNQTLTVTGAGNTSISGTLQNSSGSGKLVKSGAGILTLSGTNSYTGATTINGGVVSIASDANLGTSPGTPTAGHITLNGGTLRHTSTGIGSNFVNINRSISIGASGGTIDIPSSAAILVYAGGSISGAGNIVTKTGPGTLRLSVSSPSVLNTATSFQKLLVTGGLWQGALDTSFGAVPGSFLADAITLDGGGISTNGGISFSANRGVTVGANGGTINSSSVGTINAVIRGTAGGGLTKTGSNLLSLLAINTYDGSTTLSAGSVAINATSTLGNGAGEIIFNGGSLTLLNTRTSLASSLQNPLRLLGDATLASTTSLTSGTRVLPLGANAITASTGNLSIRNPGSAGTTFALRFTGGGWEFSRPIAIGGAGDPGASQLQFYSQTPTGAQTFSGVISGAGSVVRSSFTVGVGGDTILSAANTYTGGTTISGGFLGFGIDSVGSPGSVTSGPVGTAGVTINDDTTVGFFAAGGPRVVANTIAIGAGTISNTTIKGANSLGLSGTFSLGSFPRTLTVTNTALTTISGKVTGTAAANGLTKAGPGTLKLSGDNTFTGGTTVSGGTLLASNSSGSAVGVGSVSVSNATLGGNGFITGAVNINANGTLAPGESIGDLDTGALTFADETSKYLIEIDADAELVDRTNVTGGIALNGATLQLSFAAITPGIHTTPQTYVIVNNDASDTVGGTFATSISAPPWASVLVNYAYSGLDDTGFTADGNDIAITITYTPEPTTLGLVLLSNMFLARRRRA